MKHITYYRPQTDGSLVRYKLLLDENAVFVSDTVYAETENDQEEVLRKFPHLADQIAGGALFELQPDGSLLATFVPEIQKEAYRFFAGSVMDFDGVDELRAEFERLKAANGNPGCTDCSYGKLLRDFMPKVVAAISTSNAKKLTNPGT